MKQIAAQLLKARLTYGRAAARTAMGCTAKSCNVVNHSGAGHAAILTVRCNPDSTPKPVTSGRNAIAAEPRDLPGESILPQGHTPAPPSQNNASSPEQERQASSDVDPASVRAAARCQMREALPGTSLPNPDAHLVCSPEKLRHQA